MKTDPNSAGSRIPVDKRDRLLYYLTLTCGIVPVMAYRLVMRVRNLLFDAGILKTRRVNAPVISIGNIAAGGTGKTPMAAWVAEQIMAMGRRPAILSRGYGRQKREGIDDENELLRRIVPGAAILVGPDRARLAGDALDRGIADAFVMDDGFQHRWLARDLDIVMLDATESGPRLLFRREGESALRRAAVIVVLHAYHAQRGEAIVSRLRRRFPGKLVCTAGYRARGAARVEDDAEVAMQPLRERKFTAFCGIGNPASFLRTLKSAGLREPEFFTAFPDHHSYTRADVENLAARAERAGAGTLLTTAKDAVKLKSMVRAAKEMDLLYVEVELEITEGKDEICASIRGALARGASGKRADERD